MTGSEIAEQLRKKAATVGGVERQALLAEAARLESAGSPAELLDALNQQVKSHGDAHKELMRRRDDLQRRTGADVNKLSAMAEPSGELRSLIVETDKELQDIMKVIGSKHRSGVDHWKTETGKLTDEANALYQDPDLFTDPAKLDRLQEIQDRASTIEAERKAEMEQRNKLQKALTLTEDQTLDKLSKALGVDLPEHVRRDIMRGGSLRGQAGAKVRATAELLARIREESESSDMPIESLLFGDESMLSKEQLELRKALGNNITGLDSIIGGGAGAGRDMEKWLSDPGRFRQPSERDMRITMTGDFNIHGNTGSLTGIGTSIDGTQTG